jgi:hypothetical protein
VVDDDDVACRPWLWLWPDTADDEASLLFKDDPKTGIERLREEVSPLCCLELLCPMIDVE